MKNFLLVLVLLGGCSSFEFVYEKKDPNKSLLMNSTFVTASGDDTEQSIIYLNNILDKKDSSSNYELNLQIKKVTSNLVVETSSVATKYIVTHTVNYSLLNTDIKCTILKLEKITSSYYDSKSDGYSFGSDRSKKDIEIENIKNNIDGFLIHLNRNNPKLKCINEN